MERHCQHQFGRSRILRGLQPEPTRGGKGYWMVAMWIPLAPRTTSLPCQKQKPKFPGSGGEILCHSDGEDEKALPKWVFWYVASNSARRSPRSRIESDEVLRKRALLVSVENPGTSQYEYVLTGGPPVGKEVDTVLNVDQFVVEEGTIETDS